MTAKMEDYKDKKQIFDVWAMTWDETSNKLRCLEDCLPANGQFSMRPTKTWGTDPSRSRFLRKERKAAYKEDPTWKDKLLKRKIKWKISQIAHIDKNLQIANELTNKQGLKLPSVIRALQQKKERDLKCLQKLQTMEQGINQFLKQKAENRINRIEKRRKKDREVRQSTLSRRQEQEIEDITDFLDMDFDFVEENDLLKVLRTCKEPKQGAIIIDQKLPAEIFQKQEEQPSDSTKTMPNDGDGIGQESTSEPADERYQEYFSFDSTEDRVREESFAEPIDEVDAKENYRCDYLIEPNSPDDWFTAASENEDDIIKAAIKRPVSCDEWFYSSSKEVRNIKTPSSPCDLDDIKPFSKMNESLIETIDISGDSRNSKLNIILKIGKK